MKNPALAGFVFTAVIFGLHNAIQPYQALGQYSLLGFKSNTSCRIGISLVKRA
jgi:hypothetical protein